MRKIMKVFMASVIVLCVGFAPNAFAGGDAAAGKSLFNNKKKGGCKVCHKTTAKKLVGPGLKDVKSRHTEGWMKKWIADPNGMWTAGDKETEEMKVRLKRVGKKKTRMKPKGKLSSADVDNVVAYIMTL